MKINAYLHYDGNCKEAFEFYAQVLGGKIIAMVSMADTPMKKSDASPELLANIVHARLAVGDQVLMGSDSCGNEYNKPQGFSVTINLDEPAEADRVFAALSEGATVVMPMEETFWAKRFGMLVDRFGTPWMVNCEKVPM